jgi:hypothetical protein
MQINIITPNYAYYKIIQLNTSIWTFYHAKFAQKISKMH